MLVSALEFEIGTLIERSPVVRQYAVAWSEWVVSCLEESADLGSSYLGGFCCLEPRNLKIANPLLHGCARAALHWTVGRFQLSKAEAKKEDSGYPQIGCAVVKLTSHN